MGRLAVRLLGWGKTDEDAKSWRAMGFTGIINGRKKVVERKERAFKTVQKGAKGPGLLLCEVGIVCRHELN